MGKRWFQHSDMCGCDRCARQYEGDGEPQPVWESVEDPNVCDGCGDEVGLCRCWEDQGEPDDRDDDGEYEDCGLMSDGQCTKAGSEECDWECGALHAIRPDPPPKLPFEIGCRVRPIGAEIEGTLLEFNEPCTGALVRWDNGDEVNKALRNLEVIDPPPKATEEPRNIDRLWAKDLTDDELKAECGRLNQLADTFFAADPEDIGHGGSPGEGMFERLEEIETQIKLRAKATGSPVSVQE